MATENTSSTTISEAHSDPGVEKNSITRQP